MRATHSLFIKHLNKIRQIPLLNDVLLILCPEANLGFEHSHLLHAAQDNGVRRWICLQEGPAGAAGLHTTHERKDQYMLLLREALTVGKISISKYFFSHNAHGEAGLKQVKTQLRDELCNFAVLVEAPKHPSGKPKKSYTGDCC